MRRIAILIPLLVGLVLASAAGAAPRGAPSALRTAQPADHAAHPGALTEWWALRAVHPRGRGILEVRALREGGLAGVRVAGIIDGAAFDTGFGLSTIVAGRRRLAGLAGTDTGVVVDLRRRALLLSLAGPTAGGQLRARGTRRGPAAFGWRLGAAVRDTGLAPATVNWTVPVATSSLSGALLLDGTRALRLRRWRASYEHGWGGLLLSDGQWKMWDQYVVHGRRADEVWLVNGLNRVDTITGPGARDAQWLGALSHVDGSRVRVCRPRVHRRGWIISLHHDPLPSRLRAACGRLRFTARDRSGTFLEYIGHFEALAVATGHRGARGVVVHLGH
jgi:hypothetical protein